MVINSIQPILETKENKEHTAEISLEKNKEIE